jgi:hypothetical protein
VFTLGLRSLLLNDYGLNCKHVVQVTRFNFLRWTNICHVTFLVRTYCTRMTRRFGGEIGHDSIVAPGVGMSRTFGASSINLLLAVAGSATVGTGTGDLCPVSQPNRWSCLCGTCTLPFEA